ncbi:MAG: GIY-YIG nuclease family protein [Novosphingobium sp.]
MLDFRTLLELADFDPAQGLIVRHTPIEKSLKRVLPWLVAERPDLFRAYQQIQWSSLEAAMKRGKYIASFVAQDTGSATFAGIYRIGDWQQLDYAGYRDFPGNRELEALGMSGRTPETADCLAFDLEKLDVHADYVGRLVISWPKPYQNWWRWATKGGFLVTAIDSESRFVRDMPAWEELVLNWHELRSLPASWQARLAEWRGIYMIYDVDRKAGYVGSACGSDNLLGRWLGYARTGHGGNVALRSGKPESLRFSILQRTSPDLEPGDVIALESRWKNRLHTREFGLNRN